MKSSLFQFYFSDIRSTGAAEEIDGINYKSHQYFEAGSGREGWFTNAHLNEQFRYCLILFLKIIKNTLIHTIIV